MHVSLSPPTLGTHFRVRVPALVSALPLQTTECSIVAHLGAHLHLELDPDPETKPEVDETRMKGYASYGRRGRLI